jgi:3-hydroxyisobutyrate dehydrogenase-like beta-hydroxyacid dehydrogenase
MAGNPTIGFIGLGSLGTPIAENILEKNHRLVVYNRTSSKTVPLKEKGATIAKSVRELAEESDFILSIVSDDAALKSVAEGADGILAGARKGSIHISMSTILPATAKQLHQLHQENQTHYLAAPVFGRPEAAKARKLNFAISGEEKIRKQAEPLLRDAGATGVWEFGDSADAANKVKLCGNFMIAAALEAIGETISLAQQSGIDPRPMWDMFTQTMFAAPIYINYGKIILDKKFEPAAFTAKLGLKDLKLVLEQAAGVKQLLPLGDLLRGNLEELVQSGKENIDWSAMFLAGQKN